MKRYKKHILFGAGALGLVIGYLLCSMTQKNNQDNVCSALYKIWSDQVVWTCAYSKSIFSNLPDSKANFARLIKNQELLGYAIAPYYGPQAGQEFTRLCKEHVHIASQVIQAAHDRDTKKFKEAVDQWHNNSEALALFLHKLNHHWSQEHMVKLFNTYLALLANEFQAHLAKNWTDETTCFDKVIDQAHAIAQTMAEGLMKK